MCRAPATPGWLFGVRAPRNPDPMIEVADGFRIGVASLGFVPIEFNVGNNPKTPLGTDARIRRAFSMAIDRAALRLPIFGDLIHKATVARWTRTLSTMFAAGVPLVEALDSVAGAAGNYEYYVATKKIQSEVATGSSLVVSMQNAELFPNMVLQMVAIGEEAGSLDGMLSKVADFFEGEVDDAVEALSSLMEPLIMVVLGTLIGGMVIAMYLPIFKMGQAV